MFAFDALDTLILIQTETDLSNLTLKGVDLVKTNQLVRFGRMQTQTEADRTTPIRKEANPAQSVFTNIKYHFFKILVLKCSHEHKNHSSLLIVQIARLHRR